MTSQSPNNRSEEEIDLGTMNGSNDPDHEEPHRSQLFRPRQIQMMALGITFNLQLTEKVPLLPPHFLCNLPTFYILAEQCRHGSPFCLWGQLYMPFWYDILHRPHSELSQIDISWRNDLNSTASRRFCHFGESLSFSCMGKCLQEYNLIGRDLLLDTPTGLLERSDLLFTLL